MLQRPLEGLMPERCRKRQALKKGGLGLISMQERVRALNGEWAIDSKPGSGTVVIVSVPLSEDREQCAAQS
jgi:signal transduction histidine kinase